MKIGGLRIGRMELAEKVIDFFMTNNLFSDPEIVNVSAETIAEQMEYSWYVEQIIQVLIARACNKEYVDLNKLKELLIELSDLRSELEQNE